MTREKRTISFSVTEGEHAVFALDAAAKGLSVSQYCKMAAFSHLAKYASKGPMAKLLEKQGNVAQDPINLGSGGNLRTGH